MAISSSLLALEGPGAMFEAHTFPALRRRRSQTSNNKVKKARHRVKGTTRPTIKSVDVVDDEGEW
jgi:hypothetical protein